MDPLVVEDELEFFGIDLHQMIADYDEIVATNNPEPPKTLKESINMTVRRNTNALNSLNITKYQHNSLKLKHYSLRFLT